MLATIAVTALLVLLAMFGALWVLSLKLCDVSIVDRFWGISFVLVALTGLVLRLFISDPRSASSLGSAFVWTAHWHSLVLMLMVALWGLRLSAHIHFRNRGHGEDPRYAKMRSRRPAIFPYVSLLSVFWLQAALSWIIAAPIIFSMAAPLESALRPNLTVALLAMLLFGVGFYFEAVGDWQLARFKDDPQNRGKVMREGLWAYTRHPNYFGDALVWWAIYLFTCAVPGGWITVFSPVLMSVFLRYVSGVSLLESSLRSSRPGYAAYIDEVPAFFPRFVRKT